MKFGTMTQLDPPDPIRAIATGIMQKKIGKVRLRGFRVM